MASEHTQKAGSNLRARERQTTDFCRFCLGKQKEAVSTLSGALPDGEEARKLKNSATRGSKRRRAGVTRAGLGNLKVFSSQIQLIKTRGGNCSIKLKKAMKNFKEHKNSRKKGTGKLKNSQKTINNRALVSPCQSM